jgi:imidazole glycerol-phosphate synthase subunit HisH
VPLLVSGFSISYKCSPQYLKKVEFLRVAKERWFSMPLNVVIVDYGTGNLQSVKRSLDRLGATATVSSNPREVRNCDKILLPGVGHVGRTMQYLEGSGLADALTEAVLIRQKPVLGICLGMELMATVCEEGDAKGLGWIKGEVVRFGISNLLRYKVPHVGWNQIQIKKRSLLLKGVPETSEFYFVHSYHYNVANPADTLSETDYETKFVSAIEKDHIFGVQFHPEKSFEAGSRLLKNFIDL